ncbi:nicotinamide-nucleotide adenylyltransferase [Vibrio phage D51]
MTKQYECALVLGKFMDAHVGHEALFHHALSKAEHLIILVCGQSTDRNPIQERVQWIEDTFGNTATVNAIDIEAEGLSGKEESDRGVSADWADWVTEQYACVDLLVGSEDYVRYMGEHAELDYEIFDQERKQFNISSTKVNEGQHWRRIDAAKHARAKRVVLVGPESCGKTTAAHNLNYCLKLSGNVAVEEQARKYLNPIGGFSLKDLEVFALAQELEIRRAISNSFHPIQIIDSSAVTTKAYQLDRFGKQPPGIIDALLAEEEGFYLLYTPETEWVDDGTREMPTIEDRWKMFNLMAYVLEDMGMKYAVITGKCHKDRLDQAIERITEECL